MARQLPRMESLLSCRTYPIHYLVIPKCGCTFVKNLIWQLDHGTGYVNPPRIHERTRDFARVAQFNLSVDEVRAQPYSFVVLRNPLDRFLSLYFDKVVGDGYRKFVPLRAILHDKHGLNIEAKTPAEHTANCHILIDWIEANLAGGNSAKNLATNSAMNVGSKSGGTEIGRDPHWTPQANRMETIRVFDMKVLPLSGLDDSLTRLLQPILPDISEILGKLERYATNTKEMKNQVLDAAIKDRILQVYRRDADNYARLEEVWARLTPKSSDEIPRASQIFA